MKLSVMTYRASSERLNLIRQTSYNSAHPIAPTNRRGSSLDSWLLATAPAARSHVYRKAFSDKLRSPPPSRRARVVSFDLSDTEEDDYEDDPYEEDEDEDDDYDEEPVSAADGRLGVMMVDGSPRRVPSPPQHDARLKAPRNDAAVVVTLPTETSSSGTAGGGPPAPATIPSPAGSVRTSRSRWLKLRTTVQLSSAITQVHKKPPLKREDSFLKRFSTRQIPDPSAAEGASRRGLVRGGFFFGSWRSVVNPDENILFYWLFVLTLGLLYNAWTIIARQAFPELQDDWQGAWFALDGFTDLVFVLDILFQFRTGYLEQGLMVCESYKLAGHYFRSKPFLMDIVAITPLDLLQIKLGILPILRFPRFLKVYRSFRFYYMVESRTIYPNLWRVVNLIHILLLLAHWFGCFYYMLSELEGFDGEWSYPRPIGAYATLPRKYLGSVYWSTLTLTTIGDLATPATNLQYSFTIISYLIGVFIFATIVGQVGNVITNRNASRLEFERLLDGAKLYMRHHKVPRNMQRRVQRWYDYSWSRGRMQGGGDINSALGILPDKLKTELALHVNLKTLKKVSIFQECQPEFLHDLVLKMKAYIFTPGDLICRKGEVAREMFIIADGILEVISETGKVLTQMKAGDFFGEIGILNLDGFNRRTADVRSVGYSELFSLSREDILAAMKDYPEAQEILQTMGRKRLMEARLAANVGKGGGGPESLQPPAKKAEGGRKGAPRSRTAVNKLKEDVRSLKKLLRSRSTPTGKSCTGVEQVELKPMPPSRHGESSSPFRDDVKPNSGKRNASFKTLMKKIHFKGDPDTPGGVRGLRNRLTNMRSKGSSPSVSLESSGESSASATPLNKGLPLLQRIRLLGEQEKASQSTSGQAAPTKNPPVEVIGEGLPLLERLKLLRAKEQTQGSSLAKDVATKGDVSAKSSQNGQEPQKPSSPRLKSSPFAALLSSSVPKVPTTSKVPSPKKEAEEKRPLVVPKARVPEYSPELPLLKKVLLMKMMEEKKPDPSVPCRSSLQPKNGNSSDASPLSVNDANLPDRVYLEQFSRTLGFQMSEDVVPVPRARLNAQSSLSPSPTKEPSAAFGAQETTSKEDVATKVDVKPSKEHELVRSNTEEGYEYRRKGKLSRMMALREDSDEKANAAAANDSSKATSRNDSLASQDGDEGDTSDDPFVKNIDCQTEVHRSTSTSSDTWTGCPVQAAVKRSVKDDKKQRRPRVEDGIQEYLLRVMKNVKHAMKAYVVEQQQEMKKRIQQLEKESQEKDSIIRKLRLRLDPQESGSTGPRPSSTFDEVSSLDASSLSSSDTDNGNVFPKDDDKTHDNPPAEDDGDEDDLDEEAIRKLQQKLSVQRKSWPHSISAFRKRLPTTKQSYSLDDEQAAIELAKPDDLWKLEFPATSVDRVLKSSPQDIIKPGFETIPERLNESVDFDTEFQEKNDLLEEPEISEDTLGEVDPGEVAGNDWEVRMLVQQYDRNVQRQRRRHSSGEVLSWNQALLQSKRAVPFRRSPEAEIIPPVRGRRKYSLVDERLMLHQYPSDGVSVSPSELLQKSTGHLSTLSLTDRTRTLKGADVKKTRRKSYQRQRRLELTPDTLNNNSSLPLPPSPNSSIGMLRWLSMDDSNAVSIDDSSRRSSMCSQETVIGVDSRFGSLDDISHQVIHRTLNPICSRSPSSPNMVSDREFWEFDATPSNAIPEWPSSPCLPTITEDQPSGPSFMSSPCRSYSHDCLPRTDEQTVGTTSLHHREHISERDHHSLENRMGSMSSLQKDLSRHRRSKEDSCTFDHFPPRHQPDNYSSSSKLIGDTSSSQSLTMRSTSSLVMELSKLRQSKENVSSFDHVPPRADEDLSSTNLAGSSSSSLPLNVDASSELKTSKRMLGHSRECPSSNGSSMESSLDGAEGYTESSHLMPFAQSREDSVVIAIPEYEPLLSP